MTCPNCNGPVKVVDTTHIPDDNEIYRKRQCCECKFIFYTTEFIVEPDSLYRKLWTDYNRANSKNRKKQEKRNV